METKLSFSWRALKCALLITGVFGFIVGFTGQTPAQLDPAFGTDGVIIVDAPGYASSLLGTYVLSDGKILMVTRTQYLNNLPDKYFFIRRNADGTTDNTFGTGGSVELPIPFISTNPFQRGYVAQAVRQSDGKIILVGSDNNDGLVMRFNENGTFDTGFASGGIHRPNIDGNNQDWVSSAFVQADGRIVISGVTANKIFLLRYQPNGSLDPSFGSGGFITHTSLTGQPYATLVQSSGKIVVLVDNTVIRRFDASGNIDGAFTSPPAADYTVIGLQSDDKIIALSKFNKTESLGRTNTDIAVSRFSADGVPDSGFGSGGSVTFDWARYNDESPAGFRILPGGDILISAGSYIEPNRSKYKGSITAIARLTSAGTVTGKFLIPIYASGDNSNIAVLPGGKILMAGGYFNNNSPNSTFDLQLAEIDGVPTESYRFKANPFDFKYKNDGLADPTVFRPGDLKWYLNGVFPGFLFGSPGDITVPADYIGKDYQVELAVFRPSNGNWYISGRSDGGPSDIGVTQWGQNGDVPAPADYDGDGKADLAVFRPSTGAWYIKNSSNDSVTALYWGQNGDKPVPGDFDGDGRDDIAVFRPSNGTWYIIRSTAGQLFVNFGLSGDIPVQEDYDGDGKADVAIWRPSNGVWYRINSSDNSIGGMQWGLSTDLAVPADYDGDFKTDISIWRPSTGQWYIYQSSTNAMSTFGWGVSTDVPVETRY